jgi:hypothetical protein
MSHRVRLVTALRRIKGNSLWWSNELDPMGPTSVQPTRPPAADRDPGPYTALTEFLDNNPTYAQGSHDPPPQAPRARHTPRHKTIRIMAPEKWVVKNTYTMENNVKGIPPPGRIKALAGAISAIDWYGSDDKTL